MSRGLEGEIRRELEEEFEYPFDIMLDPSLFASARKFAELQDSKIFEMRHQSTLEGEPRVGEIYVPNSFVKMLEDPGRLEVNKTETWDFYRKQANSAFPEEVREYIHTKDIRRFSVEEYPEYADLPEQIDWRHTLGELERYELLIDVLSDELVFLATSSKLLSRIPDTINTLRDGGLPTIDIGRAHLKTTVRKRLRSVGHRDVAKYCALATSNSAPLVDPLFGAVVATSVDIVAYHIDP